MNKQKLIEYIQSLPEDIDVFTATDEGDWDCVDIKIFTTPKSKEFYQMYFGGM